MEFIELELADDKQKGASEPERQFSIKKEWAEFVLRERIIYCLLGLLSLSTVVALVMIVLIATGKMGHAAIVISGLTAATVGCIGRLLNNAFKSVFRTKL